MVEEKNAVMQFRDENGQEKIIYPATKAENIIGTFGKEKIEGLDEDLKNIRLEIYGGMEYGMRWVDGASAPEVERCMRNNGILYTGDVTGLKFSVNADGSFSSSYSDLPIWGEMTRVTLNGQVMVQIPKYYIKRETVDGYMYTWVCKKKKDGYRCAGIFLQSDGVTENDYYYIGAYESTNDSLGESASGRRYDSDEFDYQHGYNITEYREAAKALGDGWGITTIAEVCDFWQVILPIEFGTRDAQSVAAGICAIIDPPVDEMFPELETPYRTGLCDSVANYHGIAYIHENSPANSGNNNYDYNGQSGLNCGANPFVYRGIENPYGCIEKYVDGLTLYNQKWYACNNRETFATDTIEGYTELDYIPPEGTIGNNEGYVKDIKSFDNAPYCQLPSEFTDTEYTYFTDEFDYSSATNRHIYAGFGGYYIISGDAGVWYLYVCYDSAYRCSYVGARLSYAPV